MNLHAQHRNVRAVLMLALIVVVVLLLPKLISFINRWNQVRTARQMLATSWAIAPGIPNRLNGSSEFWSRAMGLSLLANNGGDPMINHVALNLGTADRVFNIPDGTQLDYWCSSGNRNMTLSVFCHADGSVYQIGFDDDDWSKVVQPSSLTATRP